MSFSKQNFLALSLIATVIASSSLAMAERNDVTVKGPGVSVHQKTGLFGTHRTEYRDAMGNHYTERKGLFGRQRTEGGAFGASVRGHGNNISVKAPNGNTVVEHSHHWWNGNKTTIDANGAFGSQKQ